jgi:GT2 family glycosyltransferase
MPSDSPHDTRITVVVITRNRRAELGRTLNKLAELPEHPAIIVVDNGSDDGTAAHVRWEHPDVQLIAARDNLGAVGRNLALRRITTPYVAFCDDDTWWEPGSLTLAADLDAHPDVASVTARIVVEPDGTDDPITPELAGSPLPGRRGLPGPALLSIMAGASVLRAGPAR